MLLFIAKWPQKEPTVFKKKKVNLTASLERAITTSNEIDGCKIIGSPMIEGPRMKSMD